MYRILKDEHGGVIERRQHVQRPSYEEPELLGTAPNQVWSWDITKLKGPVNGLAFIFMSSSTSSAGMLSDG